MRGQSSLVSCMREHIIYMTVQSLVNEQCKLSAYCIHQTSESGALQLSNIETEKNLIETKNSLPFHRGNVELVEVETWSNFDLYR